MTTTTTNFHPFTTAVRVGDLEFIVQGHLEVTTVSGSERLEHFGTPCRAGYSEVVEVTVCDDWVAMPQPSPEQERAIAAALEERKWELV